MKLYLSGGFLIIVIATMSSVAAGINRVQDRAKIEGHGKVVHLPGAVEQPRSGSKICVDLTRGGPSDAINPGLEKVARYVNIYAAAGKDSVDCRMIVVLHGEATAIALDDDAYQRHLGEASNPSLPLIRQLEEAGVDFVVCGQSMASKGYKASETSDHVHVAVSALTANVNRQADGYAFIPLH